MQAIAFLKRETVVELLFVTVERRSLRWASPKVIKTLKINQNAHPTPDS